MKKYKKITIEIKVPNSDYCVAENVICDYFLAEGGEYGECCVHLIELDYDEYDNVKKPIICK